MKNLTPLFFIILLAGCSEKDEPTANHPLLTTYTTFVQTQAGDFRPGEKIEYSYTPSGVLTKETQYSYDTQTKSFDLFSVSSYSYKFGKLVAIEKNIPGVRKITTSYQYTDDRVSKIFVDDDIDTDASVTYLADGRIEVLYNHSNGRFFTYRFSVSNSNKDLEEIIGDDQQLASKTTHQYDNKKNPFSLLGYTDLFFANISPNNRITTSTEFFGGNMPQSVPISYEYKFNEWAYPTEQITTYKSLGGSGATSLVKSTYEYY